MKAADGLLVDKGRANESRVFPGMSVVILNEVDPADTD